MIVLAHGLTDAVLPIPTELAQMVALAVILALIGAAVVSAVLASLFGRAYVVSNPAVIFLWSVLPAGLLVATLTVGPAARQINPLRTVSRLAIEPAPPSEKLLGGIALCGLFALVWARSAIADEAILTGIIATAYIFSTGATGAIWGQRWFDRGDPVEVAVATLSSGRNLGRGAMTSAVTLGVVAILIGGAIADSLVETGPFAGMSSNAGLAAVLAAASALVAGIAWLAAPASNLRPALAPLAMSYLAVHAAHPSSTTRR